MTLAHTNPQGDGKDLLHRLWLYTNYDCNLSCSYCVAESFVRGPSATDSRSHKSAV